MIKHYCDCCGEEISDKNETISITPNKNGYHREVKIKIQDVVDLFNYKLTEPKDICKYCLITAIKRLDNRPKAQEKICINCNTPSNSIPWSKD